MKFKITYQYTRKADKFLSQHEDVREQFEEDIETLINGEHPEKIDNKRLKGKFKKYSRIRIGNYRVVYLTKKDTELVVVAVTAGSRGDVYKKS